MNRSYTLDRHRYLELKHFCLQYSKVKERYQSICGECPGRGEEDPTSKIAILKTEYMRVIQLIEMTAMDTDPDLWNFILRSVTEDVSFTSLNPPCNKGDFDDKREKFFYILSERKGI